MTEIEYALYKISVLEDALSSLISLELSVLQPHGSDKWRKLNSIYDNAKRDLHSIDVTYNNSKDSK